MATFSREEVLKFHQGGKVAVHLPKPLKTQADLCLAYTPGVAHAVKEIAANPEAVFDCTAKSNLVAVVSDGTAILGLGDLGAAASIPVMEGKAVLFKAFADVDAWPVPLARCRRDGQDTGKTDPQRVIDAVAAFLDQRHVALFEEVHELGVEKLGKAVAHPTTVGTNVGEEILERGGVGEVAAAFTGDAQFATGLVHFLDQHHLCTLVGGGDGSHHACGTGANDDDSAHRMENEKMSAGWTQSTGICELCTICWALVPRKN